MNDFGDLLGTPYAPVSKIAPVKGILNVVFNVGPRDQAETIESGPLCITDLFKNKSVAYYLLVTSVP